MSTIKILRPICYMLIGIPGSGKTTWVLKNHPSLSYASTDKYIDQWAAEVGKTYNDVFESSIKPAISQMLDDVSNFMYNQLDFVWDQTNLTKKSRANKLCRLIKEDYKIIGVIFETPKNFEERLASRPGKNIPANVMESMIKNFEMPSLSEVFLKLLLPKMSNIFFVSDLHAYHRRIQEFCPTTRKGKDWEEMTEILMQNLTSVLKPGDVLYNLGDVAFQGQEFCYKILERIAATGAEHHLILGNHDYNIRKHLELRNLCASVQTMKTIFVEKQMIVMCHFPLAHWESEESGSIHLFGHCHGSFTQPGKCMDVGIDARPGDMMPWTWDEVKCHMKNVKQKIGHHGVT